MNKRHWYLAILTYGAPQICFFSCNMGAPLRSVSLFTIWALPPQISFFACYRGRGGGHLTFRLFSRNICGPPQISFSAYYMGSPQISFCAYFLGAPLRSVFSLKLLYGAPSEQFLRILYGGPLRSFFSPNIWGSPESHAI